MNLRQMLETPLILRSESNDLEDGGWVRALSYPEIDCKVEGLNVDLLFEELEIRRFETIIESVRRGTPPSVVREGVTDPCLESVLRRVGLEEWIPMLDLDIQHVVHTPTPPRDRTLPG